MKKIVSILIVLLVALSLCGCDLTEGYPTPTDRFFVNDFADIISDEDENEIYNDAANLYNKTTAQVVVITVDDLNGEEIADYALNIGREICLFSHYNFQTSINFWIINQLNNKRSFSFFHRS